MNGKEVVESLQQLDATWEKVFLARQARILRLLGGRQPKGLKLATLLRGIPLGWEEQRRVLGFSLTSR